MDRFIPKFLEHCTNGIDYLQQRRRRVALSIFLALCLNLVLAPALYAADGTLSRGNAYALGLLGLVVVGLAVYLTAVILKPEQF